jgi:hypothetical protein
MVTPEVSKVYIPPFWDGEYKHLSYERQPFNDPVTEQHWKSKGFSGPFTGLMCDMRKIQPSWNLEFLEFFSKLGWKNIGTSYYRMETGNVLPNHVDLYKKYVELFNLQGVEHLIMRAVVFLENWQTGHYAEYNQIPFVNWRSGDCVIWTHNVPHMAANLGDADRYTLQITGHL